LATGDVNNRSTTNRIKPKRQAMTRENVQVRRIYDEPTPADGTRVLVDRIWPRGMTKTRAHLDQWCKEIAPSTELRKWYHHDPARFGEFIRRYHHELSRDRGERLVWNASVVMKRANTLQ
jgi:uncharacterized protein YeaO (DUF488 family)